MNDKKHCILSVDAGGTFLKATLVSRNNYSNRTLIRDSFFKIPVDSQGDISSIKASYIKIAVQGLKEAFERNLTLCGIGISIPGPFDYAKGICLMKHKYSSIYGISMLPWFKETLGDIPVNFIHDSTAFILGAADKAPYKKFKKIGAVILGTGLGFATLIGSKVFSNPQGGPGISIYSKPYRQSTAEEYVSRRAIIRSFKALSPNYIEGTDVADIASLARSGNKEALKVFNDIGIYLAEITHDILRDNNYECLLLGGAISKSSDLFIEPLKKGLSDIQELVWIEAAEDIDNAPLIGAAKAIDLPHYINIMR